MCAKETNLLKNVVTHYRNSTCDDNRIRFSEHAEVRARDESGEAGADASRSLLAATTNLGSPDLFVDDSPGTLGKVNEIFQMFGRGLALRRTPGGLHRCPVIPV